MPTFASEETGAARQMTPAALANERVLVTGGSGFIGRRLCTRLIELGAEVHAVSRIERPRVDEVRWWVADVGDADDIRRVVQETQPHVIVNLAGYVSGSRSMASVLSTARVNLMGAVNVLVAASNLSCRRVVLAGSLEEPSPDQDDGVPASPYAAAKLGASAYGRMFHRLYDTGVVMLRLFMVYGPGQADETKLVPYVIRSILRGEAPELSSGRRPVDWIYVDDVVKGLIEGMVVGGIEGQTIDLGTGLLTPVRSVVEEIARQMDTGLEPRFGLVPDRPYERICAADVPRTRELLAWAPQIELEDGLASTIDWYASRQGRA